MSDPALCTDQEQKPPRWRSLVRAVLLRLIAVALSLGVTCLLLEVALRLWWPVDLHPTDTYLIADRMEKAGALLLVPDARTRHRTAEFDVSVRINSHGLRDREFPYHKPPGTYRVLVLGDSQTFGQGVEAEETYPKVLERLLSNASGRRVEVLNTGVPGTGTAQQLYFLDREGWRYEPDALVTGFFFNDVNNNRMCDLYTLRNGRLERDGRTDLDRRDEDGQLKGSRGLYDYHPPVRQPPPGPSFWVRHSHLVRFVRERLARIRQQHEPDEVRAEYTVAMAAARDLTAHLLGEIRRQCRDHHARNLVVLIPSRKECDVQRLAELRKENAAVLKQEPAREVLDLMPAFQFHGGGRLFYPYDQHLTREGHRIAAQTIARKLLEMEPALSVGRGTGKGSPHH